MTTELVVIEKINPVAVFAENGLDDILKKIDDHFRSIVLDPSTAKGREEIRSVAFQITKTRTALFKSAKDLTEDWRTKTTAVNKERGRMEEHLLALEEEIRKPLTEFEEREKQRVKGHERALEQLATFKNWIHGDTNGDRSSAELLAQKRIESEQFFVSRPWEEFETRAREQQELNDAALAKAHTERVQWDKDQAELARLRQKEIDDAAQAERDRIAQEAADKAKAAAEAEAAVELIWEQAHRDNAEFDLRAAKEREETQAWLAIYAEAENENRLFDAEVQRKADVAAAEQRAADNAWLAMVEEAERENVAYDEQARKERNTRHRGKINREAREDIMALGVDEKLAQKIVGAIIKEGVRHVSIQY